MRVLYVLALFVISNASEVEPAELEAAVQRLADDDACLSAKPGETEQCSLNAIQRRGVQVAAASDSSAAFLDSPWGSCSQYGCGIRYDRARGCQCNSQCYSHHNCCHDYQSKCEATQASTTTPASVAASTAGECFTTGVYFSPNMPQKTMESSSAACQSQCAAMAGCAHFSFWPDGGCHLQASDATSREASSNYAAVVSGPDYCPADAAAGPVQQTGKCGSIDEPANAICKKAVVWAGKGGKWDPHASSWFADMKVIAGVDFADATQDDFQRLYFCAPPGGKGENCGVGPCQCSKPPCNTCYGGAPPQPKRPGCEDGGADVDTMKCKPPAMPMDYKGKEWPAMTVSGPGPFHFFSVGDWGGMDGSLNPIEGRIKLIAYPQGAKAGPSVFPRTRWNKRHTVELCGHKEFVACYASDGANCLPGCGFVKGVDDQPQILVANSMKARAAKNDPKFVLNVGDNFYWGGIEKTCGTPMDQLSYTAHHQFDQIYERVYTGAGLDGKPWFSVLGNHDWGGRVFNNGWDQQIAYTWHSTRWVMPAPYYTSRVDFPDAGFSVDLFFLDSNYNDAEDPSKDSEHNICGVHNPPGADCSPVGGPSSVETCKQYFADLWQEQVTWVKQKLSEAKGDWQIAVTHFPCGHAQDFYKELHQTYGLDLLVTGHRHDQELWDPKTRQSGLGGLTCFVTGGGGGISSEATPNPDNKKDWYGEGEYGFFDLTISKSAILIESINYDGKVLKTAEVQPN
eukprot:TRINITY_DN89293_c0_g1_i1.p1 TRINITY_DN89293_c0_g1~~TRINITY_DN89293_c0_g1_i1.p1  ORF type:complete len:739 (+),score=113.48 TRINITY_DN89293_c0_g1_i1:133-2349(+)